MTSPDRPDALLERHRSLVDTVARRRFPAHASDPDLLQCGMIGLWRATEKWDGQRPFVPFAKACIHNAMVDHLRAQAPPEPDFDDTLPPPPLPTDHSAEDRILSRRIAAAWPPGPERAALLSIASGTPKRRLACEMGLSGAQLTRLLKRAWKKVKQEAGDPP